jgi:N6-L-threonylcarbamoyladenine synthase
MSFSGLKTAVSRSLKDLNFQQGGLYKQDVKDFSASFQTAISDVLSGKSKRAIIETRKKFSDLKTFAIVGGVAANQKIRSNLLSVCNGLEINFVAPPLSLCTDNAAMIAYAAGELYALGHEDDYFLSPRSRWPLDENKAPMLGSGKRGAKA